MSNRNMAEYTNFEGNCTNKKIVQAPGGASSFSLAWSNQKTDYGQERVFKKLSRQSDWSRNQNMPNKQSARFEHPQYAKMMPTKMEQYKPLESNNNCNQQDQIDLAMRVHNQMKSNKKISAQQYRQPEPNNNGVTNPRSCIRINGPARQNMIFGENNYNYWKEDTRGSIRSGRQLQQNYEAYGQRVSQKSDARTSVKVHNPPGGKQSFTLA